MERHYPASDVTPQSSLDLLRADLDLISEAAPRPGGRKRSKAKAKAQRNARRRNR